MKNFNKPLIIVFGVICLAVAGLGLSFLLFIFHGFIQWPVEDKFTYQESSDWKMYMNQEYGFEFQYPNNWKEINSAEKQVTISRQATGADSDVWFDIQVITDFYDKNNFESQKNFYKNGRLCDSYEDMMILGYSAFKCVANPTNQSPGNIMYEFVKNNLGYRFTILYPKMSDGVGEQILSTFKFIDQNDDGDLRTYENKNDWQINYPQGWSVIEDFQGPDCIQINNGNAYISIRSGPVSGPCGATGLGLGSIKIEDTVSVNGDTYNATGFKYPSYPDEGNFRYWLYFYFPKPASYLGPNVGLNDEHVDIEYGGYFSDEKMNSEVKQIISTFKFTK